MKIPSIKSMLKGENLNTDKVFENQEKSFASGTEEHALIRQREYWWIWAIRNGKLVVFGKYYTLDEANSTGYTKFDCPFEPILLPTKDSASATSMIKAKMVEDGKGLDFALQRAKHQL